MYASCSQEAWPRIQVSGSVGRGACALYQPVTVLSAAIRARRARPCGVCVAASIASSRAARLACGSLGWTIGLPFASRPSVSSSFVATFMSRIASNCPTGSITSVAAMAAA